MSTIQIWEIDSSSLDNTLEIAGQLGQRLKGGELIDLVSDLGGGKTTFVKGLAKGMGITEMVGSPSYTISSEYKVADLTLRHFDFFRIGESGLMANSLDDVLGDPQSVIAIEWSDLVETILPERVSVHIHTIDDKSRRFKISYPEHMAYLIPR